MLNKILTYTNFSDEKPIWCFYSTFLTLFKKSLYWSYYLSNTKI